MRTAIKLLIVLFVLGGLVAAGVGPTQKYLKNRNKPKFRIVNPELGDVTFQVNSTGTVKPIREVKVGAFVSGPIVELKSDFNDRVKEGDLLARIDPRLYDAAVAGAKATLESRHAEITRVEQQLSEAKRNETRAMALRKENPAFLSDSELDRYVFSRRALEAQLQIAKASALQAAANLENSNANLKYTEIRSPVTGIVIDRKIDPGQTLASSFQTPELFIVAEDLDKRVYIYASVDEADIGYIHDAKESGKNVSFTVDAYQGEMFTGEIFQIRKSATTTQNVVTYPVVVEAPNLDMKLLPGMTASISFEIEKRTSVVRIPNAALRFFPAKKEWVREEDHGLIDGKEAKEEQRDDDRDTTAAERVEADQAQSKRHVWVLEDDKLKAIEITIGLGDNRFTELVAGDLTEDDELVVGLKPKE